MYTRREWIGLTLAVIVLLCSVGCAWAAYGHKAPPTSDAERSVKAVDLRNDMRQLWEEHVVWTRIVIVSIAAGLPDTDSAVNRLLRNQVDIGNAIKPYYGDDAGAKLTSLLQEHIKIAGELLVAAKAVDTTKTNDAAARWYNNGDQIADFLAAANPKNWPSSTGRPMMKLHLQTTLDEATARLHSDWAADVAGYDKAHDHILTMADALSLGIIRQFPDKFTQTAAAAPAPDVQVELTSSGYSPKEASAAAGAKVIWVNKSGRPHTAAADSMNAAPGGPDSGKQFPSGIQPGESFTWMVPADAKSGTKYYYHCTYHGAEGDGHSIGTGMAGVITVK